MLYSILLFVKSFCFTRLQQRCMAFNCLLHPLGLDADVSLGGCRRRVLQQLLHQSDIMAVAIVYVSRIPLAETVCSDALISQVVTNYFQILLKRPLCDREHSLRPTDIMAQAVVLNVLLYHQWNGEGAGLAGLLFCNVQSISITVPHNIAESERKDITDTKSQISFDHQGGGGTLICAEPTESRLQFTTSFIQFGF